MTETQPNLLSGPGDDRPLLRRYAVGLVLALLLMLPAALLLGRTLGTFFAGFWLCAVLLPMAMRAKQQTNPIRAGAVVDGIGVVWLGVALADAQISLWDWLQAYVLLLSMAFAQWSMLALLTRWIASVARATAVIVMLLWLASPIWLLHHLQTPGRLPWMQRVIEAHPLFAMNAILPLSIWSESPLTYRLMNLNQDVFYQMPNGPWQAIGLHALAGAVACLMCAMGSRRR